MSNDHRGSTFVRFEQRHPDLRDEVQAMIEQEHGRSGQRPDARSVLNRLFRLWGRLTDRGAA